MTKPKPQPRQPESQDASNFSSIAVEEDVQPHDETTSGMSFDKLLSDASQNLSQGPHKGNSRATQWRNRRDAKKGSTSTEAVSNFIVTILTLIISAWQVPQDLKPTPDEVDAFSVPATKLLMRHVNLTGKLTQDALDVIGMVAAISAYGVRTNEGWKQYRAAKQAETLPLDDPFKTQAAPEGRPL